MTIKGVDIASHQSEGGLTIDWQAVKDAGNSFVVIKATGGAIYKNKFYAQQLAGARAAGLMVGHYHYAHELSFEQSPASAAQEAEYFLKYADIREGEFAVLDIEDPAIPRYQDEGPFALAWLDAVGSATNSTPWLYTFPNYGQEHKLFKNEKLWKYPLWYASYWTPERPYPQPDFPAGFNVVAWQWSGGSMVPGFKITTDQNIFFGDENEMRSYGKRPAEALVEEPGSVRAYLNKDGEAILEINFGGWSRSIDGYVVPDAGITTIGFDGKKYHRSIKTNFLQWEG